MATIKSYTDIEQSRKLADILPLESADMYYGYGKDKPEFLPISDVDIKCLSQPCWSIAALLEVIPSPSLHKTYSGWRCDSFNEEGVAIRIGDSADNAVDACVAMIELLYEQKLL